MHRLCQEFRFFADIGVLYQVRFREPLWTRHPNYEYDGWDALAIFLEGYAFARQGTRPDFAHAASDAVAEARKNGVSITNRQAAQLVWERFARLLGSEGLNHANNPLCPKGTKYKRKTGWTETYQQSALEFLSELPKEGEPPNIILYATTKLQGGKTSEFYDSLRGAAGINGIGSKIASFFLRDVATRYDIHPSKDRHLLQPIDIWVRRITEQLLQEYQPQGGAEFLDRWLVQVSTHCSVNPEAVNQGIWYFGSQIAGSGYRTFKALKDLKYAKSLLDEHIEILHQAGSKGPANRPS